MDLGDSLQGRNPDGKQQDNRRSDDKTPVRFVCSGLSGFNLIFTLIQSLTY